MKWTNAPYPPSTWTHFAAVLVCRLAITVDALSGTKRSQTSCKEPHKPIINGVLKAYNLFRWAQNRMVNQQRCPYLNKLHVWKVSRFPFPYFCFLLKILWTTVSCYPLKFCAGKLGCGQPGLIPLHTTDVWQLRHFKAQPRYQVGFCAYCSYCSGYRFNLTRYVVLVFRKVFHWFLTYAPRLHREGRTIFVPDQLSAFEHTV